MKHDTTRRTLMNEKAGGRHANQQQYSNSDCSNINDSRYPSRSYLRSDRTGIAFVKVVTLMELEEHFFYSFCFRS
jgi:hypothetical protein